MIVLTYQHDYGVVVYTLEKKTPGELSVLLARVSKVYPELTGALQLHFTHDGWREAAKAIDVVRQYWDGGYDVLISERAEEHKALFQSWMDLLTR